MKIVDLEKEALDLLDLLRLARQEPVLLVTADGANFIVSGADDFDHEVEQLRSSMVFQHFLDVRSAEGEMLALDELVRLLDAEVSGTQIDLSELPEATSTMFAKALLSRRGTSPDSDS